MSNTATETLTASFTNFKGEWMIRTNRPLNQSDKVKVMVGVLGGGKEEREVFEVEVTLKSGATKTVRVGEYETKFAAKNGMPESHIYSVLN